MHVVGIGEKKEFGRIKTCGYGLGCLVARFGEAKQMLEAQQARERWSGRTAVRVQH